jgi:hypothetical protein
MSELVWGRDFPKVKGWYWFRDKAMPLSGYARVIEIDPSYLELSNFAMDSASQCEWAGPIPEPKELNP